jgi:hypothetical protein
MEDPTEVIADIPDLVCTAIGTKALRAQGRLQRSLRLIANGKIATVREAMTPVGEL